MQLYQEKDNDDAYFFVEIPYLDLERLHAFCSEYSIKLELKYVSREEILSSDSSNNIHESLKQLFTCDLTSFVEQYIERGEPVPIKARYAVICIQTTPTNYRTLGLLGSYYK